jgi:5-methylcytosine-specific restriction endonuclease McrA
MSSVFVVDTEQRPLNPVHPGHARYLLSRGDAAVLRRYPFTLILRRALPNVPIAPLRLKLDPGSKTTGLAIVNESTGRVEAAAEITHRRQQIHERLDQRRAQRRGRRQRHTRYRAARFDNRRRAAGWLAPSLESRMQNTLTWVRRFQRLCPLRALSLELVRFDAQLLQNAEIGGVVYQQGELSGYEVREYMLEKWQRKCAYCGSTNVPLQIEHITPKARGGSDRVSNLALACKPCNIAKGTQTAAEFGHPDIQAQAKQPLSGAAAVNTMRWVLYRRLTSLGLPLETGTGGRTKWNRTRHGLPKTHWLDAACVGASTPATLSIASVIPLLITAMGRESRQMCRTDKYGFPRTSAKGHRRIYGFQTGDLVRVVVPTGVKNGTYVGRVAVRATGSFNIRTAQGLLQGISWRHCHAIQRADGYTYTKGAALPSLA